MIVDNEEFGTRGGLGAKIGKDSVLCGFQYCSSCGIP